MHVFLRVYRCRTRSNKPLGALEGDVFILSESSSHTGLKAGAKTSSNIWKATTEINQTNKTLEER